MYKLEVSEDMYVIFVSISPLHSTSTIILGIFAHQKLHVKILGMQFIPRNKYILFYPILFRHKKCVFKNKNLSIFLDNHFRNQGGGLWGDFFYLFSMEINRFSFT